MLAGLEANVVLKVRRTSELTERLECRAGEPTTSVKVRDPPIPPLLPSAYDNGKRCSRSDALGVAKTGQLTGHLGFRSRAPLRKA